MSTTLLVLVPIGMLAVAWSLCFVGCALQTHGLGETNHYSNDVLGEQSLIAYWPLNDAQSSGTPLTGGLQGSTSFGTAHDFSGNGHDGTYVVPPAYPPNQPMSASFTGPLSIGPAGSIVPGDISSGGVTDKLANPGSADFEGGYVNIPWTAHKVPQLSQFTFEAWIAPNASSWGTNNVHVLFGSIAADSTGNTSGVVIAIDQNNHLQVIVGNGTAAAAQFSSSVVTIDPIVITYVAVTGDSSTGNFNFFVSGQDGPLMTDMLSSTGYVATDPTQQQLTFFIGAGRNDQPPRTQPGNPSGAPLFPFQGRIQSVALYGALLDSNDLQSHFSDGTVV